MQIARLMGKLGDDICRRYAAKADAFFQETPAKDLSELWPVKEIWESRIAALEQLLREAEHAGNQPDGFLPPPGVEAARVGAEPDRGRPGRAETDQDGGLDEGPRDRHLPAGRAGPGGDGLS